MLTADRLREVLVYDPETGVFTWRINRRRARAGAVAGNLDGHGYWQIGVDGRSYSASRLAWLYMTGAWPRAMIDHRDLDALNDRFVNLREATREENNRNKRIRSDSTHGFKGAYRSRRKWVASIMADKRKHYLGTFDTPQEAHAAYSRAAETLHGSFARTQ